MSLGFVFLILSSVVEGGDLVGEWVDHARAHPRGDKAYTFDMASWKGDSRSLPVGVFDSGMGGLTVLDALLTVDAHNNSTLAPGGDGNPDLEGEEFIYLGDKANMPYGNYDASGRLDFLRELVLKDALFLLGRRWRESAAAKPRVDKPPVKAIVIACNTATAAGLEDLRSALRGWDVPVVVVGVVEAGATGVLQARRTRESDGRIAVLATVGTCRSGAYPRLIQQALGRAGRPPASVIQQGSPELAGLIEGDPAFKSTLTEAVRGDIKSLLDNREQAGKNRQIDLVVLGCTHFPLVRDEIDRAFEYWRTWESKPGFRPYSNQIAPKRDYVDPAEWTARELFRELASARLLAPGKRVAESKIPRFFVSVPNPGIVGLPLTADGSGLTAEYKYGRNPGRFDLEDTVVVPLQRADLPPHLQKLVQERLPAVWHSMAR